MFWCIKSYTTRVQMLPFGTDTALQSFCHSFIALPMIRCSKSAQKSAVQMCQFATVVIKTTQLVLIQFKNVFTAVNAELNNVNSVSLSQK